MNKYLKIKALLDNYQRTNRLTLRKINIHQQIASIHHAFWSCELNYFSGKPISVVLVTSYLDIWIQTDNRTNSLADRCTSSSACDLCVKQTRPIWLPLIRSWTYIHIHKIHTFVNTLTNTRSQIRCSRSPLKIFVKGARRAATTFSQLGPVG